MSDNFNFNDLWTKQSYAAPNLKDLISQIESIKRYNLKKLILTNLLLIATLIFILLMWVYYQPQLLTSKLGIILIILSMTVFLFAYNSYSLFKSNKDSQSNSDYIKNLLYIKAKQKFMETSMLNLYFILLSTGIGLYMYEYTSRMKPIWGLVTYGITFIWISFNWVYLRPKLIKKQRAKLDTIISKFELVKNQLDE